MVKIPHWNVWNKSVNNNKKSFTGFHKYRLIFNKFDRLYSDLASQKMDFWFSKAFISHIQSKLADVSKIGSELIFQQRFDLLILNLVHRPSTTSLRTSKRWKLFILNFFIQPPYWISWKGNFHRSQSFPLQSSPNLAQIIFRPSLTKVITWIFDFQNQYSQMTSLVKPPNRKLRAYIGNAYMCWYQIWYVFRLRTLSCGCGKIWHHLTIRACCKNEKSIAL